MSCEVISINFLPVWRCKSKVPFAFRCSIVLYLFCIVSNVSAQDFKLSGRVIGENGNGLSNAYIVVVEPQNVDVISSTYTDANGEYHLTALPDSFDLNVSYLGYKSLTINIREPSDLEQLLVIEMSVLEHQLNEVVVKGYAPKIERGVGKFVISNVFASPFAIGSNAYNFLQFMPLVNVKPNGGIDIMGKANAIILINGKKIGTNNMAENLIKGIPANDISRIEIIPVTGSANSAENRSGVINIVLKKQANEGMRIVTTIEDCQGFYNSPQGVLFLNHAGRKIDITAGLTTSYNHDRYELYNIYNYLQVEQSVNSSTREVLKNVLGRGYVNMNYHFSDKQTLGAQFSLNGKKNNQDNTFQIDYNHLGRNQVDSIYFANVLTNSPKIDLTWGGNLSYTLNIGANGSYIIVDADYKSMSNSRNISNQYRRIDEFSSIGKEDFCQFLDVDTKVYGGRIDYFNKINKKNTLRTGLNAYHGKVDNDYSYFNRVGDHYELDAGRTNHFVYTDNRVSGFVSFKRIWSDKVESEIGLRAENYYAEGRQLMTSETVKRQEFDIFPSLSLLYMPFDNHEFSLDFSRSIFRPFYGLLNPFISHTSPTTYTQNNPDIKSSKGYEVLFTYTLFNDYMLNVDYQYDNDLWAEFNLPVGEKTRIYTDNYGNSHLWEVSLLMSKNLFRKYLSLNVEARMGYNTIKGTVNDYKLHINDFNYGFILKTNVALSKKNLWYLNLKYTFSDKSRAAAIETSATQEMEVYLMKQFKRASLSLGVYNFFMPSIRANKAFNDYSFSTTRKRWTTGVLTFSYMLGNQNTRRVDRRKNEDIEKRMQ